MDFYIDLKLGQEPGFDLEAALKAADELYLADLEELRQELLQEGVVMDDLSDEEIEGHLQMREMAKEAYNDLLQRSGW